MNSNADKIKLDYKFLIPIVLSILGIIGSFSIYLLSKETRSFTYEIISFNKLLNLPNLIQLENKKLLYHSVKNLSLQYKNKTIEDPYYTLIKLKNTGSSPIKTNDFESNIQIQFDQNVIIFESSILDKQPKELNTNISIVDSKTIVKPTLFNPDDFITIGILSSAPSKNPIVTARIIGIKSLEGKVINSEKETRSAGILLLIMAIFITWAYASIFFGIKLTRNAPFYLSRIEAIIICIFLNFILGGCIAFGFDYLEINLNSSPRPTFFYLYTLLILLEIVIVFFVKSKFSPEAWNKKGIALEDLNKSEEAHQAFEKAIALKPDSAQPWYNKARNYALKGSAKDALYDLEKAIKCDLSSKERAKKDEAFKELWNGKDFKRITD